MKLRQVWLFVWALLLPATGTAAQSDSAVVAGFFPQRLIDESRRDHEAGGPLPYMTSTYVVADLEGDGSSFIVAAYSNGFSGAIRVLTRATGVARLVDEPDLPVLSGIEPAIRLLDFEGDGRPEVVISYTSARGPTADWVFRWDAGRLEVFGPTTQDAPGVIDTVLSDAEFEDLDGDGVLEILNPTGSDASGVWQVHRLEEGRFVARETLTRIRRL